MAEQLPDALAALLSATDPHAWNNRLDIQEYELHLLEKQLGR